MSLIELLITCFCVAMGTLFSAKFFASYGALGHIVGFIVGTAGTMLIITAIIRIFVLKRGSDE